MSIAPDEICRRFGEAKFKEMFGSLNANEMKGVLQEASIPSVRLPSHTSTRKRNEDWFNKLWHKTGAAAVKGYTALMFRWLTKQRAPLLTAYLDAIGVAHQGGLTDADFLNEVPEVLLQEEARKLLADERFDKREVAAYLLFLDFTNQTQRFAALELDGILSAA